MASKADTALSRRSLLKAASGFAAESLRSSAAAAPSNSAPNIIFVLGDDIGYGDFACLGNPYIKTPNLDKLHAESVRFTNFHVSPTCAPSRASLMTGRYCDSTGVWHTIMGRSLLDPREVTLAQCFKSSGYRTGIFGKWHLGDNYPCRPQDVGFDEVAICGGGGVWQTPDYFGNDYTNDFFFHNGKPERVDGFCTDVWFRLASQFIEKSHGDRTPFFCYLATNAAHAPDWAPAEDTAPYTSVPGLQEPGFYGMIANLDKNMGRLLALLEQRNLSRNTILIFATDNGTSDGARVFNAGMRGSKGSPYDGGHRVPFWIRWPDGDMAAGQDIGALAAHIDVLPTLADLCHLRQRGKDVHGRSLKSLLSGDTRNWQDRPIVIDNQRLDYLIKWKQSVVMTQRWRLVSPSLTGNEGQLELYDMPSDPGQQHSVIKENSGVVQRLTTAYDDWWLLASERANQFVRIALGAPEENPTRLTCMDWHGDADEVWNQRQIRKGPVANGYWAVEIARTGKYRFQLRRWPEELDLPINAPYVNRRPNREQTPGQAISAVRARVRIGPNDRSCEVKPGDKYSEFVFPLDKGPAKLQTWFYSADGISRGAYYLYVSAL